MEVPEHHKTIAKHIASVWQIRPQIKIWSVEQGSSAKQAIATVENFPHPGVTVYSTVGLSEEYQLSIHGIKK